MKTSFICDLEPKQQITSLFLVQSKDIRQKKTGEPYLSLVLCDKSGEMEAKMWDNVGEVMDTFDRDDFIKVKGETQVYQNRLQLTIHKLIRVPDQQVNLGDFLPVSKRDPDEMLREVLAIVAGMSNPHLQNLLNAIFSDPEIVDLYKKAPAAKGIHHAWLGGLIEHVLSLCTLARFMARHYEGIDEDLLLSGVLLHDIGKIYELTFDRSFGYSTGGQLLGHIQIALQLIGDKVREVTEFPSKLRNLLEHMVLSHHGQLEFGSPKLPAFPEALLLHLLDNLDSKMETMRACIARDKISATEWAGWNSALERMVLNREKYLNPPQKTSTDVPNTSPVEMRAMATTEPAKQATRQATLFAEQLAAAIKREL